MTPSSHPASSTGGASAAILAQAADPGIVQAYVFAVFGLLLVVGMPIIARVPEHRGAW